ncbi:slit homolog 1 protein-like [Oppia nitens]|uniref:slit homolog 1 protein-like n=1 Tax=Oppia nitens TaxID=1686743 RepID=UPI0023DBD786|nr:slit homolog 1 protein-like [Oppia nitens]
MYAMMCQMKIVLVVQIVMTCIMSCVHSMCPRGCHCDDSRLRTVCQSEAELQFVPHTLNPALKELILKNNHIRGVQSSLSVYRSLELLDISFNQLTDLGENNFLESNRIETMVLVTNSLTTLKNYTFNGLSSLKKLYLSDNKLEEINANVLKPLTLLQILDLSHNQIRYISSAAFNGLTNLIDLNLRSNQLNAIPSNSFKFVPNIKALDLGSNMLINITKSSFASLANLSELRLDACFINYIDIHAFNRLNNLTILRLNNNNLEEIPTNSFEDLIALEELKIGENHFVNIKSKVFSNLIHLRTLEITKSHSLSFVELGAFYGLTHLERLELSHNKLLTNIDNNVFSDTPNLQYLNLRANGFVTLQLGFVNTFDRKIFLDVRDNPLHCNCSLEWLYNYLMQSNTSSVKQVINGSNDYISYPFFDLLGTIVGVQCESPPSLQSKLITDLHRDDFGCFELDTKIPIIIAILIGILVFSGVIIIFVIRCKYGLSGLVKNQWFAADNNTISGGSHRNDLNYRKPEFVFIPNIDINIDENNSALEETIRYPLKMTPITEL